MACCTMKEVAKHFLFALLQNHSNGGEHNETVKQDFTIWDPNGRWKGSFIY